MKWRYMIVVAHNSFYFKHAITKLDLATVKNGSNATIIDLRYGTYFDAELNEWVVIDGDA